MEAGTQNGKEKQVETPKTKMQKFMNFLMYGGFLIVMVAGVVIAILISLLYSYLTK